MHEIIKDLEPESYPIIKSIHKEILESRELYDDVELLGNWMLNWSGVFLHTTHHSLKEKSKYNSIYFCLLQSQSYQFQWIVFSIFSGQYDTAMRELRTTLENAFYHFKYDFKAQYRKLTVEEKYKKMCEDSKCNLKNSYGIRVFRNSGYLEWEKVYNEIFTELCKYVHTSVGQNNALKIFSEGINSLLDPKYDRDRINDCISMFKKVVVLEVILMELILKNVYRISDASYVNIFEK